jgi:hypothetical protein
VLETFFLFALERYLATESVFFRRQFTMHSLHYSNFLAESVRLNKLCGQHTADNENSFLLITTKKDGVKVVLTCFFEYKTYAYAQI